MAPAGWVAGEPVFNAFRRPLDGNPEAAELDPGTWLQRQDMPLQPDETAPGQILQFDELLGAETLAVLIDQRLGEVDARLIVPGRMRHGVRLVQQRAALNNVLFHVASVQIPERPLECGAMTRLPYWIQRADLSATDHEPVDAATAIHIVQSHDWRAELQLEQERRASALDSCPPGIGFVNRGRILHICPGSDGTALVHYDADEARVSLRPVPQLAGLGIVILAGSIAWTLIADGGLQRSLLALMTGMILLYAMHAMSRRRRLSVDVETLILTTPRFPLTEVAEAVHRFYANDHEWLMDRMREDDGHQPAGLRRSSDDRH